MTPKQARAAITKLVAEAEAKSPFGCAQLTLELFAASAVFTKSLCKAMNMPPLTGVMPGEDAEGWTYMDHYGEIVFLGAGPDGRFTSPIYGVTISEETREAAEEAMFAMMGVNYTGQTFSQFQATRMTIESIANLELADPSAYLGGGGMAYSYSDVDTATECFIELLPKRDERGAYAFWMDHEGRWTDFYFKSLIGAERKAYELTRDPKRAFPAGFHSHAA